MDNSFSKFNKFLQEEEELNSSFKKEVQSYIRQFQKDNEMTGDIGFDRLSIELAGTIVSENHVDTDAEGNHIYSNYINPNETVRDPNSPSEGYIPKVDYDVKGEIDPNIDIETGRVINDTKDISTMDRMMEDLMKQFPPPKIPKVQFQSTNPHAINFAKVLFNLGVHRWWLPLLLNDTSLDGVDPHSKNLTQDQMDRIQLETCSNIFYYCREVARVSTPAGPTKMRFHIGSFTSMYLTANDITYYLEQPRQTYKSGTDNAIVGWCWNFASRNANMALFANNLPKAKDNLQDVINILQFLPAYLKFYRFKAKEDTTGNITIVDCDDYAKGIEIHHKLWNNKIYAGTTGQTKEGAMKTGRGKSLVKIGFDEIGWSKYNYLAYGSAQPAHEEAAANAEKVGTPHNITMTSTPPDATTKEGEWLYKLLFENCVRFNLIMFDLSKEELKTYMRANGKKDIVFCSFMYNELGFTQEWLIERLRKLDREVFDVEVMLKWKRTLIRSPFSRRALELIDIYTKNQRKKTIVLNNRHVFTTYDGFELARFKKVVIGVDIAGGGGTKDSDYSTMVGIDPDTTKVLFTFRSNEDDTEIFSKTIIEFYRQYVPNGIFVVERNSIGRGVVDKLIHCSDIVDNIYYQTAKDDSSFYINSDDGKISKGKYGLDMTHDVRETMTREILNMRVNRYKTYFVSEDISRELMSLTISSAGRVDHLPGYHDDVLMAYLMALYVLYKDIDMDIKFGLHYPNVPDDESLQYNKLDVFDIKIDPYAGLTEEQKYQEFIKQNALENGQMLGFRTLEDDTYKRGNDAVEFERKAQEIYNTLENGSGDEEITMGANGSYFGNGRRVNRLKPKSRNPF